MSLDIYFPTDVESRLDGIEATAQHFQVGDFQSGFLAGLQAVRASFNLPSTVLVIPNREGTHVDKLVLARREQTL